MATRQRKLVAPANGAPTESTHRAPLLPDFGDDDERPSPVIAGEQDSLMDIMSGFTDAASVNVRVYRVIKNKPLAYVFECSPESFSMDELRDKHGGGEFRVYIHEGGQLLKNVRVMIEQPRAVEAPESAGLASVREHMTKIDKVLETLLLRQAVPPPPPPSIGDMLGRIDLPATIGAVGALLQILRPPAPPVIAPPPADPSGGIDLILKGIELAKELKGDSGGGDSSLMDVVRDLIKSPMLAQAIAASATAAPPAVVPAQPMPRPPSLPRPGQPTVRTPMGPVAAPAPQSVTSHEPMPHHAETAPDPSPMTVQIKQYMQLLTAQAAQGSDPELYAGLVLDQMDDDTINGLLERLPDPVTALIADYPPAEPYREWFTSLVEYVQGAFEEAGDEEDAPVQSGDTPEPDSENASGSNSTVAFGGPSVGRARDRDDSPLDA